MRKVKLLVSSLCIVAVLGLAIPTSVYASDDGPQGGVKSTKDAPPAPPPPPPPSGGVGGLLGELIALLLS
jgi:hypothetical protein